MKARYLCVLKHATTEQTPMKCHRRVEYKVTAHIILTAFYNLHNPSIHLLLTHYCSMLFLRVKSQLTSELAARYLVSSEYSALCPTARRDTHLRCISALHAPVDQEACLGLFPGLPESECAPCSGEIKGHGNLNPVTDGSLLSPQ